MKEGLREVTYLVLKVSLWSLNKREKSILDGNISSVVRQRIEGDRSPSDQIQRGYLSPPKQGLYQLKSWKMFWSLFHMERAEHLDKLGDKHLSTCLRAWIVSRKIGADGGSTREFIVNGARKEYGDKVALYQEPRHHLMGWVIKITHSTCYKKSGLVIKPIW